MLATLSGGQAPPHDIVLTGPRGNGKTVLLQWFERACRDAGGGDVERIVPSEVRTGQALVDQLLPPTGIRRLLPARISVGVTGVGRAEWPATASSERRLTKGLIARCRRRPLIVVLDEAHTLDLDVGRLLLNAGHNVRADAPFLLVLAGTPGLAEHLGAMNASFWNRLDDGRLGIGLLSGAAARAALVEAAGGSRCDHRRGGLGCGGRREPALPVLPPDLGARPVAAAHDHRRDPSDRRPQRRGAARRGRPGRGLL